MESNLLDVLLANSSNFDSVVFDNIEQGSPNFYARGPHQLLNSRWSGRKHNRGPNKKDKPGVLLFIIYLILFYSVPI